MRKYFAKIEINLIVLIFDKFITNVHKKEKKPRSRNYNILVNINLSVKCCSNVEKWVWDLNISTKCWYNRNLKTLKLFSNDDEISSKNITFDNFFAMTKMFIKLIFEFKRLFATMTNIEKMIEIFAKWYTLRYEIDILLARKNVTTNYVSLNKQTKVWFRQNIEFERIETRQKV